MGAAANGWESDGTADPDGTADSDGSDAWPSLPYDCTAVNGRTPRLGIVLFPPIPLCSLGCGRCSAMGHPTTGVLLCEQCFVKPGPGPRLVVVVPKCGRCGKAGDLLH